MWNIDDIVLVIWFFISKEVEMWFCYEKYFCNVVFLEFYGFDVVFLLINWNLINGICSFYILKYCRYCKIIDEMKVVFRRYEFVFYEFFFQIDII